MLPFTVKVMASFSLAKKGTWDEVSTIALISETARSSGTLSSRTSTLGTLVRCSASRRGPSASTISPDCTVVCGW